MEQILIRFSANKILHYALALCLLSSLFPFVVYGKYIALAVMLVMTLVNIYKGICLPLLLFWAWAMLCSVVNGVWGTRDVAWTIVMLSATPMLGQSRISADVFKALLRLLPLFVLANIVARLLNINYFHILFNEPRLYCFSGLTYHPQWLGAFTGLACIYLYYHVSQQFASTQRGMSLRNVLLIALFLLSIELGILAASRSALLATAISIAFITFMTSKNIKSFISVIGVILGIVVLLICIYPHSLDMIIRKQLDQVSMGFSRADLWLEQINLILANTFFGTGLVNGESGNGWFAVASKTGIIGIVLFCYGVYGCYKKIKAHLFFNKVLHASVIIYLLIHCCFEGYILTPGYLMCWVFWRSISSLFILKKR